MTGARLPSASRSPPLQARSSSVTSFVEGFAILFRATGVRGRVPKNLPQARGKLTISSPGARAPKKGAKKNDSPRARRAPYTTEAALKGLTFRVTHFEEE